MRVLYIFSICSFFYRLANCARIFGVFPIPSISHQKVFQSIYEELSHRGHEVIVVTPNPVKNHLLSNLTEIDVSYLYIYSSFIKNEMDSSYPSQIHKATKWFESLVELIFQDENVKRIYRNPNEKFDLVLVQHYNPITHIFGIIFNAPVIGIISTDPLLGTHSAMGNLIHPVLFADFFLSVSDQSLSHKIWRTYCFLWYKWYNNYVVIKRSNTLAKKYFGISLDLAKVEKDTSLVLLNTNYILGPVRPIVPNVIPLGFIHLRSGSLSPDLQEIMDKATKGVIYMSLGSNVKSSTLPPTLIQIIITTLSKLPYTVLWKWEGGDIPGLGKNIILSKWFPQQALLAHPNVKVFVTQGGVQSIEEAISKGVPMVAMPFISDQYSNADRIAELEIGLKIDSTTVTAEELKYAILHVAQNSRYVENIQRIRDIALDQPMTSLEKAVWWIEYVIRHKGAKHLRSKIADMPLWEYLLLDVVAVVLTIFSVSIFIIYKCLSRTIRMLKSVYGKKVKLA